MALNGKACGALILAELQPILQAQFSGDFDMSLMQKMCEAIGTGVVNHITAAGQVQTTVTGSCSTGPIAGAGVGKVL